MFVDVVRGMELDQLSKMVFHSMAENYENGLPDTLYMNHYELSETFGNEPKTWKEFLKNKDIDRVVESELVQIGEVSAREALKRMQSGKVTSPDIQAAKELLNTSKLLKQKTNQRPQVILTRIPAKEEELIDG